MQTCQAQREGSTGSRIERVVAGGRQSATRQFHPPSPVVLGIFGSAIPLVLIVLLLLFSFPAWGQAENSEETTGNDASVSGTVSTDPLPTGLPTRGIDPPREYKIGKDDLLAINVWHEPDLSRTVSVRPDGKITLPLVGDVQAVGQSAVQLQEELRRGLDRYVKDAVVTVMVAEIRSQRINVVGEVGHPGVFPLTESMGVVDALAQAGGLREFAKQNRIYVLRPSGDGHNIRLNVHYSDVLRGRKNAKDILLQAHDTVVVP